LRDEKYVCHSIEHRQSPNQKILSAKANRVSLYQGAGLLFTKTEGGLSVTKNIRKYKLVTAHTARRSFATNMYLAGVPTISISNSQAHQHVEKGWAMNQNFNYQPGPSTITLYQGFIANTNNSGGHNHQASVNYNGTHSHTIYGGDSETHPVNMALNFIIKY
jgi:hypothetical protein